MNATPDFLPSMLSIDGTWEEILERVYAIFQTDFKNHQATHCGILIIFDGRILPDGRGKEEGFWHMVSRGKGERIFDPGRAKRLPWARPMMESPQRDEILVFDYVEGPMDKGTRRYIWLKDFDYVLVLQRSKKRFVWITAFHIHYESDRVDMWRRYNERDR